MYPKIYIDLFRPANKTDEVFVAMPFASKFETRWKEIFEPAISSSKMKPYRTKEMLVSDSIPINILEGISKARLLMFDISNEKGKKPNPNVMYELGIAHAARLPEEVIILRDARSEKSPFDISHLRWNTFSPENSKESTRILKDLIENAKKQIDLTKDVMVKNAISSLDIDMFSFLEVARENIEEGFDLFAFDPDRKGLYCLAHRDSTEKEIRSIARNLINRRILTCAPPIPLNKKVYGQPEYFFTEFGKALLSATKDYKLFEPLIKNKT